MVERPRTLPRVWFGQQADRCADRERCRSACWRRWWRPRPAEVRAPPASEQELELAPERSFGVLRLRRSFAGGAYVGAMATRGESPGWPGILRADANHDAYTQGLDGFWYSDDGGLGSAASWCCRVGGRPRPPDAERRVSPARPRPPIRPACPSPGWTAPPWAPGAFGYGGSQRAGVAARPPAAGGRRSRRCRPVWTSTTPVSWTGPTELELDVVSGYFETRPRGWFQNFALLGFGSTSRSHDGVYEGSSVGLYGEALLRNFLYAELEAGFRLPGWDIVETTDGGAVRTQLGLQPPPRAVHRQPAPGAAVGRAVGFRQQERGAGDRRPAAGQRAAGTAPATGARAPSSCSTTTPAGSTTASIRPGRPATPGTAQRRYRFAEQDSSFFSLTTRGTYTFTSRLTLQWYGQLFVTRGRYDHFREIDTVGTRPHIRRAELRPRASPGDGDGDGDPTRTSSGPT